MDNSQNDYARPEGPFKRFFRKTNLRLYLTGMLPLFLLAHFGHHGIGAMMNPLMPMIRNDLGLDYTQAGLIMMAFSLTAGLSQLPAGWIADKVGMRVMILLGVTGVALGGFFIGFTNSLTWLIVFVVISSLLGGGYHPASAAAISSSVKEEYRGRTLGLHLVGGTSAFWVFPLIASPIAAVCGWRTPYFVVSIPLMLLGIFLYFYIGKKNKADLKKRTENNIEVERIPEVKTIHWGQIIPFIIVSVFTGTIVQSVSAYISLYATDVLGVSETAAGMLTAITPAVGMVAAPIGGYIGDRFGGMRVVVICGFLAAPLVYLLGIAPSVPILVIIMLAIGMLSNTRMPTSEGYLTSHAPEKRRGTIMGIYYFSGTGVAAPLTPVIGNLIDRIGFPRTFSYASFITAGITLICSVVLWRTKGYRKYSEITG
jgi:FSR family fosmidomycin resistance protein-like MFS transporter